MVDYKTYMKVLAEIHKWWDSSKIASAICELFDQEQVDEEYDMSPNDFQSCWCPKWVKCPWY